MDEMNRVLDYIEAHLTDDISYCDMAGMLAMSIYEFRRIFAFVKAVFGDVRFADGGSVDYGHCSKIPL